MVVAWNGVRQRFLRNIVTCGILLALKYRRGDALVKLTHGFL